MILGKIISSCILFTNTNYVFARIDSIGFKITSASSHYTSRINLRKKYAKLSVGADVLKQIIYNIKIKRAPTKHDIVDFKLIITKISKIKPLSVVVADKEYDSEENHVLVREKFKGFSTIPPRYNDVLIWKTRGKYRKKMKRIGYNKILYNQRNKDETIMSVIKRLFGKHIQSRLTRMQNRELIFRCIAYNLHRLIKLVIVRWFLQSHYISRI